MYRGDLRCRRRSRTITAGCAAGAGRACAAAAIASASRQVGQSLGVAVTGSLVMSGIHGSLAASFAAASHVGWWTLAGCGLVVFVLGWLTTGRWALATAAPDGS